MPSNTSTSPPRVEHQLLREAADWYATLCDEDVTEQQKLDWQDWLRRPQHQLAWQHVELVSQRFQQAQQQAGGQQASNIIRSTRADRVSRRKFVGGGLSCLALWMCWQHTPISAYSQQLVTAWNADLSTKTGETRQEYLADGGLLWLNTATAVNVHYATDMRELTLLSGEVLIQTAKDKLQRPFFVTTHHGRLQALGTRFSVYQQAEKTLLSVQEGAVRIETNGGQSKVIKAGQQTQFTDQHIGSVTQASLTRESWTQGMLVANNLSLQDFIDELSRYHHGHISIAPEVANLSVIGTYPVQDKARVLSMLKQALPIKIHSPLPWWASIDPR